MDKQLLKAYIRTIVEEEVKRILPELLSEAVKEIKAVNKLNEGNTVPQSKQKIDRGRLAQLMGIDYDRDSGTIRPTSVGAPTTLTAVDSAGNKVQIPESAVSPEVKTALTRDYSQLMKKMGIT